MVDTLVCLNCDTLTQKTMATNGELFLLKIETVDFSCLRLVQERTSVSPGLFSVFLDLQSR